MNPKWIVRKKRLKNWARANGVPIPRGFVVNWPTNGAASRELIRRVETKVWGSCPHGGKAWSGRMNELVKPRATLQQKALKIAQREVGIKEQPANSNYGPRVKQYQRVTGAYRAPWCASFTAWVYKQAGRPLRGFNTAYVPSYVQSARSKRNGLTLVSPTQVKPGDLVAYDWGPDGVADHIGIVKSKPINGVFSAVEGNTSYGNNSNGGQVMVRQRSTKQVAAFIRVR